MMLRLLFIGLTSLLAACTPLTHWDTAPGPDMVRLETIHLLPVAFTTHHGFTEERERIDAILRRDLTESLGLKGYRVVPETQPAAGAMKITITYIWDERLYYDEERGFIPLIPEVRLYARIHLARKADGAVLLEGETLGIGLVDYPWQIQPFGSYTEPQQDLAERISALFPPR